MRSPRSTAVRLSPVGEALAAALVGVALSGCQHVPLTSVPALARVDFATTDLGQLAAGIAVPPAIHIDPNSVEMTVALTVEGLPLGEERFSLTPLKDPQSKAELARLAPAGADVGVYGLDAADAERFAALRRTMLARKARGETGSMRIDLSPKEMCRQGSLPPGPISFDTFLKTSETGRFVPLASDVDLRTLGPDRLDLVDALPAC